MSPPPARLSSPGPRPAWRWLRRVLASPGPSRRDLDRYRHLVETTSDLVAALDAETLVFLFVSPSSQRLGWAPDELLGHSLLRFIHPDEASVAERSLRVAAARTRVSRLTHRFRRGDGSWAVLEVQLQGFGTPEEGEIRELLVGARDVTGQIEAEEAERRFRMDLRSAAEEWRTTFDSLATPLIVVDRDVRIRRANRITSQLLGERPEDLLGRSLGQLGDGEPWVTATEVAERCLETGESQFRGTAADERTWEITADPVRSGGEVRSATVLFRETTELVRLAATLRRKETMAELGALLGSVAHEARNPVFGISAVVDALERRLAGREDLGRHFTAVRRELDRLQELMSDLLAIGRPPALEVARHSLGALVREAADELSDPARRADVEIDLAGTAEGIEVLVDRRSVVRALRNVLDNALRHSPRGRRVEVELGRRRREGEDWAECTVRDFGAGFSEEALDRAFEFFFSRRRGGTGLGLPIVQRTVADHGGEVTLANAPGGGALVTLRLPAAARPGEER